jgi:hypothetical protein
MYKPSYLMVYKSLGILSGMGVVGRRKRLGVD